MKIQIQITDAWDIVTKQKFENLESQHIAFNARRTLRNAKPSLYRKINIKQLILLTDANIAFANQIWGLSPHSMAYFDEALAVYQQLGMSPDVDIRQADLTDQVKKILQDRQFENDEILNFLSVNCQDITPKPVKLEVERLQPKDADVFLNLLKTSGMQCDDDIWQLKKHHYCTDMFRCYIAKIDGQPRALATMYIDKQYGLLANAYTQSEYQNRGCQTALLHARLHDAKNLGLSALIVDVIPDTSSERNCLKVGFKPLETRYIWQKITK